MEGDDKRRKKLDVCMEEMIPFQSLPPPPPIGDEGAHCAVLPACGR